ncbi:MAG: putative rhomboid protease [Trizodia sp. TS-e1964]|nr:MAG: putative rhomboid protease [Trizodia sp. TS-e1964]
MDVATRRIHLPCNLIGIGYLKHLAPPEKILRWVEGKMNLLGRLPHYVSVDQKTYGRYGVLPSSNSTTSASVTLVGSREEEGTGLSFLGNGQRLG